MYLKFERLDRKQYTIFLEAFQQINYSIFRKGEENPYIEAMSKANVLKNGIRSKVEFVRNANDPNREMYVVTAEDGKKIGYVELIFKGTVCEIHEFAVFERNHGYGGKLLEKTMEIIREHRSTKINLYCPFEGAQHFWKKKGFQLMDPSDSRYYTTQVTYC